MPDSPGFSAAQPARRAGVPGRRGARSALPQRDGRVRRLAAAAVLVAAVGVVGCAGLQPSADWNREIDFSRYASFALTPEPPFRESDRPDPYRSPLVIDRARRAAAAALSRAGLVEVAREQADLWVSADIATRERIEVWSSGGWPGWGAWSGPDVTSVQYTEGTLIVDLIDARAGRLVWRGWASEPLPSGGPSPERVREVVDAIVGQYPPPGSGATE